MPRATETGGTSLAPIPENLNRPTPASVWFGEHETVLRMTPNKLLQPTDLPSLRYGRPAAERWR